MSERSTQYRPSNTTEVVRCRHLIFLHRKLNKQFIRIPESLLDNRIDSCYLKECAPSTLSERFPTSSLTLDAEGCQKKRLLHSSPPLRQFIAVGLRNPIDSPIGESNEKSASEKLQSWHTVYFPIDFESLGGDVENIGLFLTRCISQSSLLLPHQKFDETEDGCVTLSSPHQATAILRAYWKDKIFSTPSWKYAILPELAPLFCFEGLNCQVQLLLKCLQDSKTIESHPSCLTNLSIDPRTFSESPETLEWSTSDPQSIIPRQLLIRLHSLDPQNAAIASPSKGRALQSTSAPSSSSSSAALPSEKVQRASPISLIREGRVVKVEFLKSLTDSPLDLDHFQNLLVLPEDETFPNPRGHLDLEDALEEAPESRNGPLSFLRFKMMWHEETERIKQFLKQCIHSRELKWMMEAKYWRIPIDFAFEATKCILHMGGSIDESILHSVVQQMEDFGVLSSCENRFSSSLKKVITTAPFWGYQRLGLIIPPLFTSPTISTKGISLSEKSGKIEEQWIELHILPFNLQIPHLLKTEKLCTWSAERQVWLCSLTLLSTLAMKLCSPPLNFATATAKDRETLNILVDRLRPHRSSFHFSLPSKRFTSMNTRGPTYETTEKKSQNRGLAIKEVQKKSKLLIDSSSSGEDSDASSKKSISEDETVFHLSKMSKKSQNTVDFNTKMKFIIAGDPTAVKRISEKIQSVIRNVKPPRMGFTADGKLSSSAPGTGGFEIVGWPKSLQNWNFISFLVVPSAINKKIPIDTYHPKLLCSLVSEVFIIQEDAIDWLLKTFDRWPGPDERSHFEKWESIIKQYEPRQWGGNSFEVRQGLATSGLFADTEFFVCGPSQHKDVTLCRTIIELGNGLLVNDPNNAEYVIIVDESLPEALEIRRKVSSKVEEEVAATHGERHSTLVTPIFLYDCILEWKLKRPSRERQHFAFSLKAGV